MERFLGKWKTSQEGFPSIDEIEELLHGRW